MKRWKRILLLVITDFLLVINAFCQVAGDLRIGHVVPTTMSVKLDTLSIVPSSFHVRNLSPAQYAVDCISATLYLLDSSLLGHPVFYSYSVFSENFSLPFSHRSVSLIESPRRTITPIEGPMETMADVQHKDYLYSSGSLSRGISIGTNQDMVLNSSLNLQMSGKLSDEWEIVAAISDRNIPIQPEGNTQNLSNINNIFITLKFNKIFRLDAGDVDFQNRGTFLSVERNALGLKAAVKYSTENTSTRNVLSGGVAKGKFVRQSVPVQMGVQGPYKLYGADQEVAIAVVAGSERVYVDGVLMVRGQGNDYVIDYNTSELTFTPSMLVTAEKRVVVEFEYTDKHYARYVLFSQNEVALRKKFKFKVDFFQEQDLKNQSVQPELDNDQMLYLSQIGDPLSNVYYPYADSVAFSADRILYRKTDTLVEGVLYPSVYVYSVDPSEQLYQLNFSYLGPHRGDYRLLASNANGRTFEWVAPVEGVPQGDYSPVVQLTTPQLVQMTTMSASYTYKENSFVNSEFAISNYDKNTFSKEQDEDNVGFAYSLNARHDQPIGRKRSDTTLWHMVSDIQWQFVHRNFHAVESFREVEFARNFNLDADYNSVYSEQMLSASVLLSDNRRCVNRYSLDWFSRLGNFSAVRNELSLHDNWKNGSFYSQSSLLNTLESSRKSLFFASEDRLSGSWAWLELGAVDKVEYNLFKDPQADSLYLNSYAFNEVVAYVKNSDSSKYKFNLSYKNRLDWRPKDNALKQYLCSHEANLMFSFEQIKNQHFDVKATYRNQQLMDLMSSEGQEHYFVGNLDYLGRFFKNAIVLSTYYEIGSGMELQKSFTFIKVSPGQGTHVWIDYNGNGVEEIGEFEVAAFQDEADYVKVWLAGTEYVNTFNNQFSQSIQIRPAAVWKGSTGIRKFLSRFADVLMIRSQLKDAVLNANPFYGNLSDTNVLSRKFSLNNTFSFNNTVSRFAFDFIVGKTQNKELLYYGSECSSQNFQQPVLKVHPHKTIFLEFGYLHKVTHNESLFLMERCYDIEQHTASLKMKFQLDNKYFAMLSYDFSNKLNHRGGDQLNMHDFMGTFDYKLPKRGVLSAKIQYVQIDGNVKVPSTVSYVMLNGLSVGQNVLWGITYQLSINDYMQLAVQYDGRKSQNHKSVHTGGLTIKAQF